MMQSSVRTVNVKKVSRLKADYWEAVVGSRATHKGNESVYKLLRKETLFGTRRWCHVHWVLDGQDLPGSLKDLALCHLRCNIQTQSRLCRITLIIYILFNYRKSCILTTISFQRKRKERYLPLMVLGQPSSQPVYMISQHMSQLQPMGLKTTRDLGPVCLGYLPCWIKAYCQLCALRLIGMTRLCAMPTKDCHQLDVVGTLVQYVQAMCHAGPRLTVSFGLGTLDQYDKVLCHADQGLSLA